MKSDNIAFAADLFASRDAYPFESHEEAKAFWKVHIDNLSGGINHSLRLSERKDELAIVGVGAALDLDVANILAINNFPNVYLIDISQKKLDQCFVETSRKIQEYLGHGGIGQPSLIDIQKKIHRIVLDVTPGIDRLLHGIHQMDLSGFDFAGAGSCIEDEMNRLLLLIEQTIYTFFNGRQMPVQLMNRFDVCVSDCVISQICARLAAGVRDALEKKIFSLIGETVRNGGRFGECKHALEEKIDNIIYRAVILDHLMFMNVTSKEGAINFVTLDTISVIGKKCDPEGKKLLEAHYSEFSSTFKLKSFVEDSQTYLFEALAPRTSFCGGKLNVIIEKYMPFLEIKEYWGWTWDSHPQECYPINSAYAGQLIQGLIYKNHRPINQS